MEKCKQSFEAMVKTRREEVKLTLKDEARRIEEQAEARKKAEYDHKYDEDRVLRHRPLLRRTRLLLLRALFRIRVLREFRSCHFLTAT
jgi:hypothetical protein